MIPWSISRLAPAQETPALFRSRIAGLFPPSGREPRRDGVNHYRLRSTYDYESKQSYSLTMDVSDGNGGRLTLALGTTYAVEAASTSGTRAFIINIAPQWLPGV